MHIVHINTVTHALFLVLISNVLSFHRLIIWLLSKSKNEIDEI